MLNQDKLRNYKSITKIRKGNYLLGIVLILTLSVFWHQKAIVPQTDIINSDLPLADTNPRVTTVLAVGDIMLSRNVGAQIDKSRDPNLPFAQVADLLSNADITMGNLECPLSDSAVPIREGLVFRCLTKYAPGLTTAGFDVLSTANNHALDQGIKYLSFTKDYLLSQNILSVGTGQNPEEAWIPAVIERNGIKFAFLAASYASNNDGGKARNDYVARIEDIEILKTQIAKLKTEGHTIIVNMHAGVEYTRHPTPAQINFAHAAIDAGADVVIGEHPHWIQDIEIYKNNPIFYSLGNFIFDQMWSQETRQGLAVKLTFEEKTLKHAELIPIIIENFCCARPGDTEEKHKILETIGQPDEIITFDKLPPDRQK